MAGKTEIVDFVADNVEGLSRRQATKAFESVVEAIVMHLERGSRVQVPGLGVLTVGDRAARTGRNPKTGEAIPIAASRNVKFRASKELKDSLNR